MKSARALFIFCVALSSKRHTEEMKQRKHISLALCVPVRVCH